MSKWKILIILGLAILLLIAAAFSFPWLYFGPVTPSRDFPAEWTAYSARVNAVTPAQGDAGWTAYQRVLTLQRQAYLHAFGRIELDASGNESLSATIDLSEPDNLSPENLARAQSLFQAMNDVDLDNALDALTQHASHRRPIPAGPMLDILLPDLADVRSLLRAQRVRLRDPAINDAQRVRILHQSLAAGRHCAREPISICWLVGVAVSAATCDEAVRLATSGAFSAQQCRELASLFESHAVLSASEVFEGESLMGLDSIQNTLKDSFLRPLSRSAHILRYQDLMTRTQQWADLPIPQRQGAEPIVDSELSSLRYPLISVLMPAVSKLISAADRFDTHRRGTALLLLVEAHIRETGHPPESLQALNPTAQTITDPWSQRPFGYKVLPAPDRLGRRYILYSIGHDATDNDGNPPRKSPHDALTPAAPGTDFVLNPTGLPTRPATP